MSGFNGLGQFFFTYNWVNDAANGIPITASRMDGQFNDAANGFDLCLTRDNQGKPSTSFLPDASNSYDLGSISASWRNGFFGTAVGIGMTPVNPLDITKSLNGAATASITNGTAGTAAIARFSAVCTGGASELWAVSSSFTTAGLIIAGSTQLRANGTLVFKTDTISPIIGGINGAEVFRLQASTTTSSGILGINNSNITSAHYIGLSNPANITATIENIAGSNPFGLNVSFSNAAPNDTTRYFINCADNANTRMTVFSNGNIVNQNNSYGAICDAKLKENIIPAGSQWDDIKNLASKVSKFTLKNDPNHQVMIGIVAQDAAAISPGLVSSSQDHEQNSDGSITELDTETLSVKNSVLYMKAIKALGEALERIEALEAKLS